MKQITAGLAETLLMGSVFSCACLSAKNGDGGNRRKLRKPKPWKHTEPITRSQLQHMREEFWDTAPHYGGRREIWDALRAASEAELSLAQVIVDSAGVILTSDDMSTCYDERGAKYDLPKYVLSEPVNILKSD